MSNEAYWNRDKSSVWHPYSHIADVEAEPFPVIVRGEGVYLLDADGNRYIDGISSWWACNLGHGHPRIVDVIKRQAETLQHSMIGGMSHGPIIELSERLIDVCPDGLTRVFYASDGSSSVEAALKIAVQYWHNVGQPGKTAFASLEGGYHGDTLGAVSVGMVESFHSVYRPLLFDAYKAVSPHCHQCPMGRHLETCDIECFSSMERIIKERSDTLAAVIVEPLNQAAAGMRIYPAEYLAKLSQACKDHGVLLIVDEIAMGYGRSGKMFASEHASIAPDILCLGKGMAAGYLPISATVVTEDVYASFRDAPDVDRTFYHGHTFTGNPIAAAAAIETLRVYEDEQIIENMAALVDSMASHLHDFAALDITGDVRQIGMVGAIEFNLPDGPTFGKRVCIEARKRGALLRPLGNILYLWPPLNITQQELADLATILMDSVMHVRRSDL